MENQEIKSITQIMGLQHGKQYNDSNSLRYGHLMIMADQVNLFIYSYYFISLIGF